MNSMFVGHNIIELFSVDSTNTYLINLSQETNLPEGTLVKATHQTNGKGQRGNIWHSESGKSLCISILLYPNINLKKQFSFNKCISLAICQALNQYNVSAKIKWPNDIYVDDRKISGLLIENTIRGNNLIQSVIGIGINVNNELNDMPLAISLKECVKESIEMESLLSSVCESVERNYFLFKQNSRLIDEFYHKYLYKKGELQTFFKDNIAFIGKIDSVNELGQLVLEKENKKVAFSLGEVSFKI